VSEVWLFRCLIISNICWFMLARYIITSIQKILKSLLSIHISKASILLRDLTLNKQISAIIDNIDRIKHLITCNWRLRHTSYHKSYLSNLAMMALAIITFIITSPSLLMRRVYLVYLSYGVLNLFVLQISWSLI